MTPLADALGIPAGRLLKPLPAPETVAGPAPEAAAAPCPVPPPVAAGQGEHLPPPPVSGLVAGGGSQTPGPVVEGKSAAGPGARMPRTWLLEMPPGMLLLNANQRFHWAEKNRRTKALREAAFVLARNARIPRLECARITVEYQPPRKSRKRDAGNYAPTGKALIDGLRDAGVLPDDDSSHLLGETYEIGPAHERGRMLLRITEVRGSEA